MHLGFDMDGVIADFVPALLDIYNHLTNEGVKLFDIKTNKTGKHVGDPYLLKRIKDSPGFIRGLPPAPGAIDAIERLHRAGHEITFVSNGTNCPSSGHEKREWLFYYFSKIWRMAPLILTHEKHKVDVDVLIDDDPKNLKNLKPGRHRILWNQPYNASIVDKSFIRIYDWGHLEEWISMHE